jgi:hypothetical protein
MRRLKMLTDVLQGTKGNAGNEGPGRIDRILALTERLGRIEGAVNMIRYNNDLVMELPEVLKALGNAKDAVISELKTV